MRDRQYDDPQQRGVYAADDAVSRRRDVLEWAAVRETGRTHWHGCEEEHIVCALVLEVGRLRRELAALKQQDAGTR